MMANKIGLDLLEGELARKEKALENAKVNFTTARNEVSGLTGDVEELKRVIKLVKEGVSF
jgi:hypothetical protein